MEKAYSVEVESAHLDKAWFGLVRFQIWVSEKLFGSESKTEKINIRLKMSSERYGYPEIATIEESFIVPKIDANILFFNESFRFPDDTAHAAWERMLVRTKPKTTVCPAVALLVVGSIYHKLNATLETEDPIDFNVIQNYVKKHVVLRSFDNDIYEDCMDLAVYDRYRDETLWDATIDSILSVEIESLTMDGKKTSDISSSFTLEGDIFKKMENGHFNKSYWLTTRDCIESI